MLDDVFEVIYLVGLVVGAVIRITYTGRCRPDDIVDNRRTPSDTVLTVLSGLGLIVLPLACVFSRWLDFANYSPPAWTGWTGVVVFAGAIVLLWRAHVDLGHNWMPLIQIRREHRLVTDGVYRIIRHPMYAAHWLWAVAQVLLLQNWIAGPSFLVFFVPFYFLRVPREDAMMLDHFGEAYREYASRTGRVIPRLRK